MCAKQNTVKNQKEKIQADTAILVGHVGSGKTTPFEPLLKILDRTQNVGVIHLPSHTNSSKNSVIDQIISLGKENQQKAILLIESTTQKGTK